MEKDRDRKIIRLRWPIPNSQALEWNLGTYRGIEWCKHVEKEAVFAKFRGAHVLWHWKATGLQLEEEKRTERIPGVSNWP